MGGSCRWKRLMRGSSQPNGSPVPPYGGGDEGLLHFRKFENISNRLRPLIFRNFFRNIQKIKNVLRPSFASLSLSTFPQGEGYNIAYLFPIIFCNSAINDEISLNERYTEA